MAMKPRKMMMKKGGAVKKIRGGGMAAKPKMMMKKGGAVKKMRSGGMVKKKK